MIQLHCLWAKSNNRTVLLLFYSLLKMVGIGRVRSKLDVEGQGGGKISDVDGQWR